MSTPDALFAQTTELMLGIFKKTFDNNSHIEWEQGGKKLLFVLHATLTMELQCRGLILQTCQYVTDAPCKGVNIYARTTFGRILHHYHPAPSPIHLDVGFADHKEKCHERIA